VVRAACISSPVNDAVANGSQSSWLVEMGSGKAEVSGANTNYTSSNRGHFWCTKLERSFVVPIPNNSSHPHPFTVTLRGDQGTGGLHG
jgi:hypothetical protein